MPILVLFVSAGVFFDGTFSLRVSLSVFYLFYNYSFFVKIPILKPVCNEFLLLIFNINIAI